MWKKLYIVFGVGVLLAYSSAAWFGWELANSGSKSRLGVQDFVEENDDESFIDRPVSRFGRQA